jgi:hypothetical protein
MMPSRMCSLRHILHTLFELSSVTHCSLQRFTEMLELLQRKFHGVNYSISYPKHLSGKNKVFLLRQRTLPDGTVQCASVIFRPQQNKTLNVIRRFKIL